MASNGLLTSAKYLWAAAALHPEPRGSLAEAVQRYLYQLNTTQTFSKQE